MSEPLSQAQCLKKLFVADIKAGDKVEDIFFMAAKNVAHKKDGNAYLNITVTDKTGQMKGVVWDQVEKITSAANAGDFVRISAAAGEYRGTLQLVVKAVTLVPAEQITPSDYLPATSRNVDQMFDRLRSLTDTMASLPLKALIQAFWNDPDFVDRFKKSPAAKKMHHAYLGGLLEHTLSMALLVDKIAGHYSGVDRDLLMVGAILHDIGKVRELSFDFGIDYTDEGRLLSHIVIALDMVEEKIRSIDAFPPALAVMVKHLIISHHGARQFGSPEPPKTIEAVLLNYIDEIDSRVNGIREFMAAEDSATPWTSYHRLLERHFFKGNPNQ